MGHHGVSHEFLFNFHYRLNNGGSLLEIESASISLYMSSHLYDI